MITNRATKTVSTAVLLLVAPSLTSCAVLGSVAGTMMVDPTRSIRIETIERLERTRAGSRIVLMLQDGRRWSGSYRGLVTLDAREGGSELASRESAWPVDRGLRLRVSEFRYGLVPESVRDTVIRVSDIREAISPASTQPAVLGFFGGLAVDLLLLLIWVSPRGLRS